jgi:beta-lactam-binding protein with PASTA domain
MPSEPDANAQVIDQSPKPNQPTPVDSSVQILFAGPIPSVVGQTRQEAEASLKAAGLELVAEPPGAAATAAAQNQEPAPPADVPEDKKVRVTFSQ